MAFVNRFPIRNSSFSDLLVVIEPWANEFVLAPGEQLEVVLSGLEQVPAVGVEWCAYGFIVWAGDGGTTCEVWKAGELVG